MVLHLRIYVTIFLVLFIGAAICRMMLPALEGAGNKAAAITEAPSSHDVSSPEATVLDQRNELYTMPMDNSTVRKVHKSGADLGEDAGKVVEIMDFFYEMQWVCQKAGTGVLFLPNNMTKPPLPSSYTMNYRAERDELRKITVGYENLPKDTVFTEKILWTGLSFGAMTHVGHWIVYVATPYLIFLKEYLGFEHEHLIQHNCVIPEKTGYVYQLTSIFTDYNKPIDTFKPDKTTCYRRGYFGFPTTMDQTMTKFFDEKGHIYYQIIRERFRRWAGIAASPRFFPLSYYVRPGRKPLVTLTIRTSSSGFGRNLTNSVEIKAHIDKNLEVTTEIVSWNRYSLAKQMQIGRRTDVMVGVHGNNLIWMMVMDPSKIVIELLPYKFEGTTKGVNPAFGIYKHAFYSYVGLRANQTFLTWTASVPDHSPLAPRSEYYGKIFSHRCKRKSPRSWMCRHLTPPPELITNLVNFSLPYLGKFNGEGYHGEFPFEKEQRAKHGKLLA